MLYKWTGNYTKLYHSFNKQTIWKRKETDQLSQGWWQQHLRQNYPWPLRPPSVTRRTQLWAFGRDRLMTRRLQSRHCETMRAINCSQVPGKLRSDVACTCSNEVGCTAAGLWVNEEAGRGPEEAESSFRAELPGLSVLSSTWASGERKDFWLMSSSKKERKKRWVYFRQDHTIAPHLIYLTVCWCFDNYYLTVEKLKFTCNWLMHFDNITTILTINDDYDTTYRFIYAQCHFTILIFNY